MQYDKRKIEHGRKDTVAIYRPNPLKISNYSFLSWILTLGTYPLCHVDRPRAPHKPLVDDKHQLAILKVGPPSSSQAALNDAME